MRRSVLLLLIFVLVAAVRLPTVAVTATRSATALPAPAHAGPRMLIGADDPLTGLSILKARYAAGRRPSDDMPGWALSYLITGDETFARKAVDAMRSTHPPETGNSRRYVPIVEWSLAFDWLSGYPGFDAALRARVAGELLRVAELQMNDPSMRDAKNVMYHNYDVRHLTLAAFSLAAIEGEPSVEAKAAPIRERARVAFENILDMSDFETPDGAYSESMDYQRITFVPLALLAELRRTTTGADPALRYTLFRHYTDTYLYQVLPDGTTSRRGDNEFPYLEREDNTVLGYAINRFKDPYAAWMLRRSGWPSTKEWMVPVTEFLWDDPSVAPRDPSLADESELARTYLFRGVGQLVMRSGWGSDATFIEFDSGPYLAKHMHLDQNQFVVYHKGYLATESGADYTDTESPHYLNYYRRSVAHNTMLVYEPGEKFFWGESLWDAANDGGQRMNSSRYWNSARNRDDFEHTRDLWATGDMESVDAQPGAFTYARGDATRAYDASKVELFTRELVYTPEDDVLFVFDRVRATDPTFKKAWLLHGVDRPTFAAAERGRDTGHGGTTFSNGSGFTYANGGGALRVHCLLPKERNVTARGGAGWEWWTPGDEYGGAWGSGKNWAQDPAEGGPLPEDPYLNRMWKTFWGADFNRLSESNSRAVVPAHWRVEVTPADAAKEDLFLNVMEIRDAGDAGERRVELLDGSNLTGAIVEGGTVTLFSKLAGPAVDGEVTIPDVASKWLLLTRLSPHSSYELLFTRLGSYVWSATASADEHGALRVPFDGQRDGRLRIRRLSK